MINKKETTKKSQVTTELIIISGIVFIIFLFILVIVNQKNTQVIEYQKYLKAKDIADKTAFMINNVYISGFGSKDTMFIPSKINPNTDFTLKVFPEKRVLSIDWENNHYTAPLITSNINGTTNISNGLLEARNILGRIELIQ